MRLSIRQDRPKIVLDTNILVSALIAKEGASAKLFEMLVLGKIENYTSEEIIREIKEVFCRGEITDRAPQQARDFIIGHCLNNSIRVLPRTKIKIVEHAADNKFIETALEADAGFIITGDQHLLKLKEFRGIKILRAKEFLEILEK